MQMTSWVRPACSCVSLGGEALAIPLLDADLDFCELPFDCFHPCLGDSGGLWLKSEACRCSGAACFGLAI